MSGVIQGEINMNAPSNVTGKDELQRIFELQTENQWHVRRSTATHRIKKLHKLKVTIQAHEVQVKDALYKDLRKIDANAQVELDACYADIDDAVDNLEEWMSPVEVETSAAFAEAKARIVYEARGIVLLFGPWNFPFNLVFQPLVPIIAAGNCALVKPNEMSSHTSAVIAKIIRETFELAEIAVFEGGVDLANDLLDLPVDHIFFTGSPAVGKVVMGAAAKHLASVTLELGGKNPVIVDKDANIQDAAGKIAFLRNMNSGQVCLCPENIWVHEDNKDEFVAVAQATYQAMFYEQGELNKELQGKIIDERNLARIKGYLDDAAAKGAEVVCGGTVIEETLSVHPTILTNVPEDALIQSEEVFGPILSVFTYRDISEVYQSLHKQPKPLALYIFSEDGSFVNDVLSNTTSGGVTVNSCIMHCAEHRLPFGGVNSSGMGRYHGVHGFKELSHERGILHMTV
ncbi:MAG: aldehyde dehydrogenase (NAD+) [Alcanivorax sp.]|jgi:aldehyde dehydrogenase (NAD+)